MGDGFRRLLQAPRRMSGIEIVFPRHLILLQYFPVVLVCLFQTSHLEVAPGDGSPRRYHPFTFVFQFIKALGGFFVAFELHQA